VELRDTKPDFHENRIENRIGVLKTRKLCGRKGLCEFCCETIFLAITRDVFQVYLLDITLISSWKNPRHALARRLCGAQNALERRATSVPYLQSNSNSSVQYVALLLQYTELYQRPSIWREEQNCSVIGG
jgi:hypothetical protein